MEKRIDLNQLFLAEEKQMQFLAKVALTYRLSLASLSELLNMDEDTIYKKLHKCNNGSVLTKSLDYLFGMNLSNQIEAKAHFVVLYRNLLNAKKLGDNRKIMQLLSPILDKKATALMRSCQNEQKKLSEEDYLLMLEYQLKYALSSRQIGYLFNVDLTFYRKKIRLLIAERPDLKERYENLIEYNMNLKGKRYGS